MNGVSDITFPRPLSTQDKHICCIVIAAKKENRKERRTERKKEEKEGQKYKRKYYILLAVRMNIVGFLENR